MSRQGQGRYLTKGSTIEQNNWYYVVFLIGIKSVYKNNVMDLM